jgi:hypothetical protein
MDLKEILSNSNKFIKYASIDNGLWSKQVNEQQAR